MKLGNNFMASNKKEIIVESFLNLLETNDYDKISVTDIVENCNISRQTFYYHFSDIDALTRWMFDNEIHNLLPIACSKSNLFEAINEFEYILNKFDLVLKKSFFTKKGSFVASVLYDTLVEYTRAFYRSKPKYKNGGTESQIFWVKYQASAFVGLILFEGQKNNFNYKEIIELIKKSFVELK